MQRYMVGLLGSVLGLVAADPASALTYWYQGTTVNSTPTLVNVSTNGGPVFINHGAGDYVSVGTAGNQSAGSPSWTDSYTKPKLDYGFANCDTTTAGHAGFCHVAHDTVVSGANAWAGGQSLYMNAYTQLVSSHVTNGAGFLCYDASGQGRIVEVCAQLWGGFSQPTTPICGNGFGAYEHWRRLGAGDNTYFTTQSGAYTGQVATFGNTNFAVSVSPGQLYNAVHACDPGLAFDANQWQLREIERGFEAGGYSNSSLKAEDDLSQESALSK